LGDRGRLISKIEASLVYRVSSWIPRATQRNPILKPSPNPTRKKKDKRKEKKRREEKRREEKRREEKRKEKKRKEKKRKEKKRKEKKREGLNRIKTKIKKCSKSICSRCAAWSSCESQITGMGAILEPVSFMWDSTGNVNEENT
jgi:hypothetical protein